MEFSAIVMLIFACVVILGGLFITINKAKKSEEEKINSGEEKDREEDKEITEEKVEEENKSEEEN